MLYINIFLHFKMIYLQSYNKDFDYSVIYGDVHNCPFLQCFWNNIIQLWYC